MTWAGQLLLLADTSGNSETATRISPCHVFLCV